jgi:sulfoxide reductase heme-binding subunit YedZ
MKKRFPWLRILVHVLGWLPLGALAFDALTGRLSINPIQDIQQRLGRAAIYFLIAALAVTPMMTLTGWRQLSQRRRALGLYAFLYASLHFVNYAFVDYGFDWAEIGRQIVEKPFILLGLTGLLLLIPLAVTSFDYFMRKMGRKWKSLHRLIYAAGGVVILHYAWAKKGDLFALRGEILQPLTWGLVLALLLILRIPPVRRRAAAARQRLASWLGSHLGRATARASPAGGGPDDPG